MNASSWSLQPLAERLVALRDAFRARFEREPERIAEGPGRVNLIGEHLDYNEGCVLPAAIDRSVLVACAARGAARMRVLSIDLGAEVEFALDESIVADASAPWSNYVRGVVRALVQEGASGPGLDIAIAGDVPIGAGLSSSAALEVAVAGALREAWRLDIDTKHIALLCQRAENEFVGVHCGMMDQFASALGVAGHALLIDCRSLVFEAIPLPLDEHGLRLVVVNSGLPRPLEQSAYNQRRDECAEALRMLQAAITERELRSLRDVTLDTLSNYNDRLPAPLYHRARHVVTEQQRVIDSVHALRYGDFAMLGTLMNQSHASLRDDFEVSCAELDRLVALAKTLRGVLGARLTGAGFGGCTVQLVRTDTLDAFARDVVDRYRSETGLAAQMYVCRPSDGLRVQQVPL